MFQSKKNLKELENDIVGTSIEIKNDITLDEAVANNVVLHGNDISEKEVIDIDEYLERSGGCALYQIFIVTITIAIGIPLVFPPFLFYFIGHDPKWVAKEKIPSSDVSSVTGEIKWKLHHSDDTKRCEMHRNQWEFYYQKSTLSTEYDLVCKDSWLLALSGSVVFIGWGIGSIIMGYLSDVYGRKTILIPSLLIDLLCLLLHYYIRSIYLLIFVRFIMGIFHAGASLNKYILLIEIIGPKFRVLAASVSELSWVMGTIVMSINAYLIDDWRNLCLMLSAPYLVCVLLACFLPESIRWLNIHGKLEEAERVLQRVARINQRPLINVTLQPFVQDESRKKYSYLDLFTNCKVVILVLLQVYIWFNSGMVYYTLSWAFADIGGDLYVNFIAASAVEIPMYLLTTPLVERYGRKGTTCFSFFIVILSCVVVGVLLFFDLAVVRLGVALIGKCSIALAFMCLYIWSSEIYPTVVRSQGMGLKIVASRAGAAVSPFAKLLEHYHPSYPYFLMTITTAISLLFCCFLPETNKKPTREKFHDILND